MSVHSSGLRQGTLFEPTEPAFDPELCGVERADLGQGAWIDHLPEWVRGHEVLLEALWATTRWQAHRRRMYERIVDVPRLVASLPDDGPGHPLVGEIAAALAARYGRPSRRSRSPPTAAGATAWPFTAIASGARAMTPSWRSLRWGPAGAFSCDPPGAAAPGRSTLAGGASSSWAGPVSARGSTRSRRWPTPTCASAFSSARPRRSLPPAPDARGPSG